MAINKNIISITGDLGYGGFANIEKDFPDRFFNCQAAEFAMCGFASGLAMAGKIPFAYSIGTFLVYRPFELIRTYIDYEKIPVKLICSGRGKDYSHDGISHWMDDIKSHLDLLPNIIQFWPETEDEIPYMMREIINNKKPCFLSLKR